MNKIVQDLLRGNGGNYMLPFFWQHGEDEATLREYMKVINEANIGAVCVESRPHPDFCGPRWWQDMDIILDEAQKRDMKVWILDDSHFPTGFANGAMANEPDELCRQSIKGRVIELPSGTNLHLTAEETGHPLPFVKTQIEEFIGEKSPREYDDDRLLGVFAFSWDKECTVDLTGCIDEDGSLDWEIPEGSWKVVVLHLTRNAGYHRSYINMLSMPSVRVLIDAVYEPHYAHYKDLFGTVIAGFFSDEPELGNGHQYVQGNVFGNEEDFPWSEELELKLKGRLGEEWAGRLAALFTDAAGPDETAAVRYAYMDEMTRLVTRDFSYQLGDWCRARGVRYIGHLIEDNEQHARTGSSLGHYFRGLMGQDWAGIDDIGGQVLPQGEDLDYDKGPFARRVGEFYHYMLAKLGASAAAIEPQKHGDSMCEIFGAYGWMEGVRLEKYLLDSFMVRGINHFVPHAFSAKEFPDPDCPPHFYAHGHNPQYRHFGELMGYANRILELLTGGRHIARAAVLYHGESEWTGKFMFTRKVAHELYDHQIDYDIIPQDVFRDRAKFETLIGRDVFKVNTQQYRILLIPYAQYVTAALAESIPELMENGIPVVFVGGYPEGIADEVDEADRDALIKGMKMARSIDLTRVVALAEEFGVGEVCLEPADTRVRVFHYEKDGGPGVLYLQNEGTAVYTGAVAFEDSRPAYEYDPWNNVVRKARYDGSVLKLSLEPGKGYLLILDARAEDPYQLTQQFSKPVLSSENATLMPFDRPWTRSTCGAMEYPNFRNRTEIVLPDKLAEEEPLFSGFVRYENEFTAEAGRDYLLEISDAYEGVEVFVNDRSLGIQVVPVFRYDLSDYVVDGVNTLRIEVATTLEREMSTQPDPFGMAKEPENPSGISGVVSLYHV